MKLCPKCNELKNVFSFNKDRTKKDGFSWSCKVCSRQYMSTYREEKKDVLRRACRDYYYRTKNKKKTQYQRTPTKCKEAEKRYRDKVKNLPTYKLGRHLGGLMRYALKSNKHGKHWEELVDYTLFDLKEKIESLWTVGMSWDNYGLGKGKWNIDHIKPLASFSFSSYTDTDFKQCWDLNNLRPLWHSDNCSKGSTYNGQRTRMKRTTNV
jgi:hypothetical protein